MNPLYEAIVTAPPAGNDRTQDIVDCFKQLMPAFSGDRDVTADEIKNYPGPTILNCLSRSTILRSHLGLGYQWINKVGELQGEAINALQFKLTVPESRIANVINDTVKNAEVSF